MKQGERPWVVALFLAAAALWALCGVVESLAHNYALATVAFAVAVLFGVAFLRRNRRLNNDRSTPAS